MNLNPHHLELFYFVARHAGVRAASRNMPYGIGSSTICKQLRQFERQIGVPLYERRPFRLTPAGQKLSAYLQPMFDGLPVLIDELRRDVPNLVRLAASPIVLREHMPSMVRTLRRNFPALRFAFSEGLPGQIEAWLKETKIDVAVTLFEGNPPSHCFSEPLMRLPLVLLVGPQCQLGSAAELWRKRPIAETLICPGPKDAISRCFAQGLKRRGVAWPAGIEANSIELIETYVRDGLGIGVSVAVPGRKMQEGLRALPLKNFPRVEVGILWQRNLNAAARELIQELRRQAKRLAARS